MSICVLEVLNADLVWLLLFYEVLSNKIGELKMPKCWDKTRERRKFRSLITFEKSYGLSITSNSSYSVKGLKSAGAGKKLLTSTIVCFLSMSSSLSTTTVVVVGNTLEFLLFADPVVLPLPFLSEGFPLFSHYLTVIIYCLPHFVLAVTQTMIAHAIIMTIGSTIASIV